MASSLGWRLKTGTVTGASDVETVCLKLNWRWTGVCLHHPCRHARDTPTQGVKAPPVQVEGHAEGLGHLEPTLLPPAGYLAAEVQAQLLVDDGCLQLRVRRVAVRNHVLKAGITPQPEQFEQVGAVAGIDHTIVIAERFAVHHAGLDDGAGGGR